MKQIFEKIKQYKYIILTIIVILVVAFCWFQLRPESKSEVENFNDSTDIDTNKIMEAIKKTEAEQPPRIGKTPTKEEIFNSPYIKHIRLALNGYLDGTNTGVEEGAIDATTDEMKCGLNNFSKDYYKSKFVILDASDNDYGGVQAYIVFVDKPDTGFWVWVYRLGSWSDENGEYVLRALCENPPLEEDRAIFKAYIDEEIKTAKYYL